jgi:hypothetical protein
MEKTSGDLLDEFEEDYSGPLHGLVLSVFREHASETTDSIAESIKTALRDEYFSIHKQDSSEKS